uniref:Suppressor of forked domain-containing protein n=1 Tax=Ditylenchus dipsaci TaxID=166011 RepID=A0A915EMV0_9BILA
MFGTEDSMREVFSRACASTDSLKMHKHLAKALKNCSKNEEAGDVFESMLKKFKSKDLEVWYLYAEHLMEIGETSKARDLLHRAIQCLEKKHHVAVLCRFAQMEYRHGDVERGKTMFEKIVHTYGKKTIVWTLFIDMVLKYESIAEARKVFERAIADNQMSSKLKIFFKKWMDAEEKFGDDESQNLVRERAVKMVDELKQDDTSD